MEENDNEEIWHLTHTILNDVQISFKAKGLFLYIVLANEKKGLTLEMIQKTSKDSERSIKMGINELEKHGYVIRNMLKNEEVRWTYHLNRNINKEKEVEAKVSDVKQHPQRKKKSTRRRTTTKKNSFNHTLSNFFKEFF
ncbi:hypothetical protein SAMN04487897_12449 [Paenibacillus sp. yr247]|uniref:hypothetical protein n=1 Tax=Paenibacillus sp. yr247 TaxID=1761880 RepID=UPI00088693EA|nr:hypothetical protein [Paenibacillus sp. yr247]SDO84956.1 hypothetical protein SAMN04487897_12449 [Paenibacillus sp. yr247]